MAGRYSQREALEQREATNALLMGFGDIPGRNNNSSRGPKFPSSQRMTTTSASAHTDVMKSRKVPGEPAAVKRLRDKLGLKGIHGVHGLVRLLRIMDDNGDGVLTKQELKFGLEDLGVKLNRVELDEMFEYFDRDNSGALSQEEFLRGLRGPMSKSRQELVREAFDTFEKTHDGSVTMEDIEMAYNPSFHPDVVSGKINAAQGLREFLRQWDFLETKTEVTFPEFLEYYKNLSSAVDSDKAFDAVVRGAWGMPSAILAKDGEGKEKTNRYEEVDENLSRNLSNQVEEHLYLTTAQESQRHPDVVQREKPKVPDWIKYDGVTFCFRLYSKEITRSHQGRFDPITREFDTKQKESFVVRQFVCKYFMENDSISISETTPGEPSRQFLTRSKGIVRLEDLVIGNVVIIKGLQMTVYDADDKARAVFKERFKDLHMPKGALPLPSATPVTASATKEVPVNKPSPKMSRNQFMENSGKILRFKGVWDDPSPYGERRHLGVLYHLGDDTIEIRESGREWVDRFNLNRQRLVNPARQQQDCYRFGDIKPGCALNVFGRLVEIISCDDFTHDFYLRHGIDFPVSQEGSGRKEPHIHANEHKLRQIIAAIRSTTEQRTRFGSEGDQKRMLFAYLKRFSRDESQLHLCKNGFRNAMSGFSCFGHDAELLYDMIGQQEQEKLAISTILEVIYPPDAQRYNSVPSVHPAPPVSAPSPRREANDTADMKKDIKIRGLVQAILSKLEVMTNFGDEYKQQIELRKILTSLGTGKSYQIRRDQFRAPMAKLNCWERDADALFDAIDIERKSVLSVEEIVQAIFR